MFLNSRKEKRLFTPIYGGIISFLYSFIFFFWAMRRNNRAPKTICASGARAFCCNSSLPIAIGSVPRRCGVSAPIAIADYDPSVRKGLE
ncbi:hypothetical protein CHX27_10070 [Flavobacterium aurantiibacter]|uniref:Uncharacterized protein n=1 Tax=Flavobacterium aurantiibacter TaxID=2023067 RepID=A0A255ZPN4_9FLAO|nr:hypothetical protein CHX27_10070 [Flavobacterium aurantiibacter]